jgi:hypothetical protein
MKKAASISLMLIMLVATFPISVATHFCGGNYAATRISLSGGMASCGMEDQSPAKSSQDLFSKHCCDNLISSVSISTNYVPSFWSFPQDKGHEINFPKVVHDQLFISQQIPASATTGPARPPGIFNPASVQQQVICIFRI